MIEELNHKNFELWSAQHYQNKQYSTLEEFVEDLDRLKHIKKLITKYIERSELRERLILNHIIILNNVFGPEPTCKLLYLKFEDTFEIIKPFLVYINIIQTKITNVNNKSVIDLDSIGMNSEIVKILRNISKNEFNNQRNGIGSSD